MESDERLMEQVRDDVPGAFEQLFERYRDRLVSFVNGQVGNLEEAEDLASEVFARIWKSRKKYAPSSNFSNLLYAIALHFARAKGTRREE
jgi:RNA polymerase sigma-70 factor (ECF subfamily)